MGEPVQIRRWAGGWCLVGNGPSYLLFCPNKEVMHLSSGFNRQKRLDLKGYQAIGDDDKLVPLARALRLLSADAVYLLDRSANTTIGKWADYVLVREIQELIALVSGEPKIFEGRLRRLATLIRAAGVLEMHDERPPEAPDASCPPSPPGSFFGRDRHGQRLLIMIEPDFVFRCEADSPIAGCAQELWRKEQGKWPHDQERDQERWVGQCTVLYRVPTRSELRKHLCCDGAAVKKVCRAEGCDWLPKAQAGRPRRR
jgi:hypothetical protein